jgi:phosphoserine phosphatase
MREHPNFAAICFDCDSTLTRIEGVDELARQRGAAAEIARLTAAAMDGAVPLEDVYAKRLEILRPGRDDLAWLGERYVEEMVDGARETVAVLREIGKPVYLVSGGFYQSVTVLARAVGIELSHVRAVELCLDDEGRYAGFDSRSPLVRSDGKAEVCRDLTKAHGAVAIVGDGVTDLAARAGGAYVVGFGGVTRRRAMAEGADRFVSEGALTGTLKLLLTEAEFREARLAAAKRQP